MTGNIETRIRKELYRMSDEDNYGVDIEFLASASMNNAGGVDRRAVLVGVGAAAALAVGVGYVQLVGEKSRGTTSTQAASATTSSTASRAIDVALASGGRIVWRGTTQDLPDGWSAGRIHVAPNLMVVEAVGLADQSGVFVLEAGRVERLPIAPPIAMAVDGTVVVGMVPGGATGDSAGTPAQRLRVVDLATRLSTRQIAPEAAVFPEALLGRNADQLIVSNLEGALGVLADSGQVRDWSIGGRNLAGRVMVDASSGLVLVTGTDGAVTAVEPSSTAIRWRVNAKADWPAVVSPDGELVAVTAQRSVTVMRASDGSIVGRSTPLPGVSPNLAVWENDTTLLTYDPDAETSTTIQRCRVPKLECFAVESVSGRVVMARG